jgi:hypothetical protein
MSALPDYQKILQQGHRAILPAIDKVQMSVRSYPAARTAFVQLGEVLLAHFGSQDERFFGVLQDFFAQDREALKIIEFLIVDLKDMKIRYLVFDDRYGSPPTGNEAKTFAKDFRELAEAIIVRIRMEEEYLVPLLARWGQGQTRPQMS